MKRLRHLAMAFGAVAMLAACSENTTDGPTPGPDQPQLPDYAEIVKPEKKEKAEAIVLTERERETLGENTDFAISLMKWIDNSYNPMGSDNMMISPLSYMYAVSMLANGADGDTKAELLNVAFNGKSGYSEKDLNDLYSKLIPAIYAADKKASVSIANGLWFDNTVLPKAAFLNCLHNNYWAEWMQMDFSDKRNLVKTINSWVSRNTNGLINNIKSEEDLMDDELVILGNALALEAEWKNKFDIKGTKQDNFYCVDDQIKKVQYMPNTDSLNYYVNDECKAVDMELGNGMFCVTFIRPNSVTGITDIFSRLNSDYLQRLFASKELRRVRYTIPKFKIAPKAYSTEGYFHAKNAGNVFGQDQNYSQIASAKFRMPGLLHVATIEVEEGGVKAAGVTMSGEFGGFPGESKPVVVFALDRPFIFLVREQSTGAVLFMGKVMSPSWE